ncbi:ETC complex I subunit [Acuticoccus sp.]|uniref:ETC complex I subunit n=1 Tax=Acuticoccus sp. TaxID=1904378 RepID=UPI003B515538
MQSGTRKTRAWRLEFEGLAPPQVEPLMGWTASNDTRRQVRMDFPTREDAVAYAERCGLEYRVEDEKTAEVKKIAYADNFRADRAAPWTH